MKHIIYLLLLAIVFGFTQCCKEKPNNSIDIPGLPPATQTGANTLGFLLNGVPWIPEGPNNLSMDYDPVFNNGILGIVAYRKISASNSTQIVLGIRDSLNSMTFPVTKPTGRNQLGFVNYSDEQFCTINQNDSSTFTQGKITVSKLDRANRIISGLFECKLFNRSCGDTITITNGRFDLNF